MKGEQLRCPLGKLFIAEEEDLLFFVIERFVVGQKSFGITSAIVLCSSSEQLRQP